MESVVQLVHICSVDNSGGSFHFSAIYAKHTCVERRLLWQCLEEIDGYIQGPWAIVGDFNVILSADDHVGGNPLNVREMEEFYLAILQASLFPVNFDGSPFSWTNGRVWQHLD